jgi:hypothetical protein
VLDAMNLRNDPRAEAALLKRAEKATSFRLSGRLFVKWSVFIYGAD